MGCSMMMRSSTARRSECEPVKREDAQTDEVPIIDSNRDLKERFDERFFKSHIFFDKLWKLSCL